MITLHEEGILKEILGWDDAEAALDYLMAEYAKKGSANARFLLSRIGDISGAMIAQKEKQIAEYSSAAHWLIAQREVGPYPSGIFFATMLPVCKVMFPNGNADGHNEAEKRYFQKFLEMFHDPKQFSWKDDKDWAIQNGYFEYLQLVERQMGGKK